MLWFDREETLNLLAKRLEGFLAGYRQNLALLGPEGIGKTTLLKRLLQERLPGHSSVTAFYVEILEEDSLADWVERFAQTLLFEASKIKGAHELPKTHAHAQRLMALAEAGSREEAYNQLWDLPICLTQETGIQVMLLIDEFHRLQRLGVKDPFRSLGRKIMVQGTTLYLLASSDLPQAREILREGLSLLFGQFEMIEVAPLSTPVCLKAIRELSPEESADPFLSHLIIELAQGYPGLLDLLLKGVARAPRQSNREDVFLDLLESLLLDPEGILRARFENTLRRLAHPQNRRLWIQVLRALSLGIHRPGPLSDHLNRPLAQVDAALRVLVQKGFVVKQGVFHRIPDRLFQLWMHTAHPVIQRGGFLEGSARRAFRDAAGNWMMGIRQSIHRPMEEHAVSMIRRWSGEKVETEGGSLILPAFDRVEMISGPAGRGVIVAHRMGKGAGKGWVVIPVSGCFGEPQAQSLVREFRESPFVHYRKILIGAYPVEVNARVILQEGAIRLWDLPAFNHLLDLYGMNRLPFPQGPEPPLADTICLISPLWQEGLSPPA